MPSSRVSVTAMPALSSPVVGRISRLRFSRAAALARRWLSIENSSTSARVILYFSASRSALSPWWIRLKLASSGLSLSSVPTSLNIGTRVMFSTPAPIV